MNHLCTRKLEQAASSHLTEGQSLGGPIIPDPCLTPSLTRQCGGEEVVAKCLPGVAAPSWKLRPREDNEGFINIKWHQILDLTP